MTSSVLVANLAIGDCGGYKVLWEKSDGAAVSSKLADNLRYFGKAKLHSIIFSGECNPH